MGFESILAAVGGLIGAGTSYQNYQMQKEQYALEQANQERAWSREDNAVQRRAADLRAAGLNPVLAAGSAAQASSPIALHAPQADASAVTDSAIGMMSLMRMKEDISRTEAEKNLIDTQAKSAAWDVAVKNSMSMYQSDLYPGLKGPELLGRMSLEKTMSDLAASRALASSAVTSAEESRYNLDLAKSYGIRSGPSGAMDFVNSAEMLNKFLQQKNGSRVGPALMLGSKLLGAAKGMKF